MIFLLKPLVNARYHPLIIVFFGRIYCQEVLAEVIFMTLVGTVVDRDATNLKRLELGGC
jgi:hypothetical protein